MSELEGVIRAAWERVAPLVLADMGELKARLARRRTGVIGGPPREWCLVVRAGDRRIHPWSAAIVPEKAFAGFAYVRRPGGGEDRTRFAVRDWDWGGERRLRKALARKRRTGDGGGIESLNHRRIESLDEGVGVGGRGERTGSGGFWRVAEGKEGVPEGSGGKNAPPARHVVRLDARLLKRVCGPVWLPHPGVTPTELATLLGCERGCLGSARKAMRFAGGIRSKWIGGGKYRDRKVLWSDRPLDPNAKHYQPVDPVWGRVWTSILDEVPAEFEQEVVRRPLVVARSSGVKGRVEVGFKQWAWECPGCGRTSRTLYCPVRPAWSLGLLDDEILERLGAAERFAAVWEEEFDAMPDPPMTFACAACHGVRYATLSPRNAWAHAVAHLSRGLLYGSEVPMPAWFARPRGRYYDGEGRPVEGPERPVRRRSKRRGEILRLLKETNLTKREIAERVGLRNQSSVTRYVKEVGRARVRMPPKDGAESVA